MIYDKIYIGASLCNLIHSMESTDKILILEKENFIGGAWNVQTYNNTDVETGIHLIVPPNNLYLDKFNNVFKKYDIEFEKISDTDFFYETKTFSSYGKDGDSLICTKGWVHFFSKIKHAILQKKNIEIKNNEEVLNIEINNINSIKTNKNNYLFKKVFIPCYCNLNNITYFNKVINLNYEKVTNIHVLITVNKTKGLTKKFQGFYDKEPIGVFDRISVANIKNENIILLGRISKNYKKIINSENLTLITKTFLIDKSIIDDTNIINNIQIIKYNCAYREPILRNDIINIFESLDKNYVEFIQTHYMGHFLANYCDNLIIH